MLFDHNENMKVWVDAWGCFSDVSDSGILFATNDVLVYYADSACSGPAYYRGITMSFNSYRCLAGKFNKTYRVTRFASAASGVSTQYAWNGSNCTMVAQGNTNYPMEEVLNYNATTSETRIGEQ